MKVPLTTHMGAYSIRILAVNADSAAWPPADRDALRLSRLLPSAVRALSSCLTRRLPRPPLASAQERPLMPAGLAGGAAS